MRVWTNTEFPGHWPVGTAAVVVADTREQAAELLNSALEKGGLGQPAKPEQFVQLPTNKPHAVVLCNGDY